MIYHEEPLNYISETPKVLQFILDHIDTIIADAIQVIEKRTIEEIYLIGCGSSYNAAKIAEKYYQDLLGVRVRSLCPEEFWNHMGVVSKDALVIGISQQGTSVGVISILDRMKKKNITTIALTGEYNTEITFHADATMYVECGYEDAGATTKGFTATAFTLMLLCRKIWEHKNHINTTLEKNAFYNDVSNIIRSMHGRLKEADDICENYSEDLKNSSDLVIISEGKWNSLLGEVVLKFSETCRYPVRGFEAEEFMHGFYNSVTDNTDFILMRDSHEGKIEKLYKYYMLRENRVYCLEKENTNRCKDAYYSVFPEILPIQKLFVLTSKKRGIDLNIPKDPDFHKIMGSKLEETYEDKKYKNKTNL